MAVTGRRAEIFVPASAFNALGGSGAYGFCSNDAEAYLRMIRYKAATAGGKRTTLAQRMGLAAPTPTARSSSKGASLEAAAKELEADLKRLRDAGVTGNIPLCVYPSTGAKSERDRADRRATAIHERFHADVRDVEQRFGVKYGDPCVLERMKDLMKQELGEQLVGDAWRIGNDNKWSRDAGRIYEEILARVEESRQSCNRSVEDCDDVNRKIARNVLASNYNRKRKNPRAQQYDVCTLLRVAEGVTEKFGGARAVAGRAVRICSPRSFPSNTGPKKK